MVWWYLFGGYYNGIQLYVFCYELRVTTHFQFRDVPFLEDVRYSLRCSSAAESTPPSWHRLTHVPTASLLLLLRSFLNPTTPRSHVAREMFHTQSVSSGMSNGSNLEPFFWRHQSTPFRSIHHSVCPMRRLLIIHEGSQCERFRNNQSFFSNFRYCFLIPKKSGKIHEVLE